MYEANASAIPRARATFRIDYCHIVQSPCARQLHRPPQYQSPGKGHPYYVPGTWYLSRRRMIAGARSIDRTTAAPSEAVHAHTTPATLRNDCEWSLYWFLPHCRCVLCNCVDLMLCVLLEPQSRFGDTRLHFQVVCPENGTAVLKGLNRSFYPSTSSTTSVRANSSILRVERDIQLLSSQNYATEILQYVATYEVNKAQQQ